MALTVDIETPTRVERLPCGIHVLLNYQDYVHAAYGGFTRYVNNRANGKQETRGASQENGWDIQINGALGEAVVARALGTFWAPGHRGGADVANYQVRATPLRFLCLHDDDRHKGIYILARWNRDNSREWIVRGWLDAQDGVKPEYWSDKYNNGRPAYWVPETALRSIYDLPRISQAHS